MSDETTPAPEPPPAVAPTPAPRDPIKAVTRGGTFLRLAIL